MPRCNCPGGSCSCKVQGGAGITVTGIGTAADPYVVTSLVSNIADGLQFDNSPTVTFTVVGDGTPSDPMIVTATAAGSAELIRDTVAATLVAGANVTITPNDAGDTITIASTGGGGGGADLIVLSEAEGNAGVATTARAISAARLKQQIEEHSTGGAGGVTSAEVSRIVAVAVGDPLPALAPGDLVIRYAADGEEPPPTPGAYYEDFSTYTVGSTIPGWSKPWATFAPTIYDNGAGEITLRVNTGATGRFALTLDEVNADVDREDVDILFKWKSYAPTTLVAAGARLSGAAATETGYYARKNAINRFVTGTLTTITSGGSSGDGASWYETRVRILAGNMMTRTWISGGTEPGTWDIVGADSAVTLEGGVGLIFTGVADQRVAWIAIATGGGVAVKP